MRWNLTPMHCSCNRNCSPGSTGTARPLQRGIVLAVLAAIASSVAIVSPRVSVWDHAPGFLVFNLTDLLTALALVCLVGTVVMLFPFTWNLLILSDELRQVEESLNTLLAQQVQPARPTGGHQGSPTPADGAAGQPGLLT